MATDAKRPTGAKCKAKNRHGERCGGLAGSDGLCSAHRDPGRMRELGSRGGKARRQGVPEQLPTAERESLRQHLRANLDHSTVLEAVQRSLGGANESARVAAVKFLADLELYRKDDAAGCPRCAKLTEADSKAARERVNEWISRLVEHAVRAEFAEADERRGGSDSEAMKLVRVAVRRGIEGHEAALEAAIEAATGRVLESVANGLVI